MKAKTLIGRPEVFRGGNSKEVVLEMMRQDFLTCTKTDYMEEVRERLQVVYGIKMNFEKGDYFMFLQELKRLGYVTLEPF